MNTQISPQELRENIAQYTIIDVRNETEYGKHHIEGATSVPFEVLEDNVNMLQSDAKIVLYCNGGGKSKRAQKMLSESGFSHVQYLEGGLKNW